MSGILSSDPALPMARRVIERIAWTAIALLALRAWLIEGLIVPARVAGPSMAEVYLGPHLKITCHDCARKFACDALRLPEDGRAVCPNCGYPDNATGDVPVQSGDRLIIDKLSFSLRQPRRWETVVFRCPQRGREYCIKRVVGLPGETILIRGGEVYIDGRRAAKSLRDLRQMAVQVSDAGFRPPAASGMPSRWQADASDSGWAASESGFRYSPKATAANDTAANDNVAAVEPDWLSYRHWRRRLWDSSAAKPARVNDNIGYNLAISRELHYVDDLLLAAELQTRGGGKLSLIAHAPGNRFVVHLWPVEGRGELYHNDQAVDQFSDSGRLFDRGELLEMAMVDGVFSLAVDGRLLLSSSLEDLDDLAASELEIRPLAIGAVGIEVAIQNLRVLRDVYYTEVPPPIGRGAQQPVRLGRHQYFVLGDNSPVSADSRNAGGEWLVNAHDLVGRSLP